MANFKGDMPASARCRKESNRNSSAFRLHCHKSMHTGCGKRSLAPAGLGIPLQMQRDTSRVS